MAFQQGAIHAGQADAPSTRTSRFAAARGAPETFPVLLCAPDLNRAPANEAVVTTSSSREPAPAAALEPKKPSEEVAAKPSSVLAPWSEGVSTAARWLAGGNARAALGKVAVAAFGPGVAGSLHVVLSSLAAVARVLEGLGQNPIAASRQRHVQVAAIVVVLVVGLTGIATISRRDAQTPSSDRESAVAPAFRPAVGSVESAAIPPDQAMPAEEAVPTWSAAAEPTAEPSLTDPRGGDPHGPNPVSADQPAAEMAQLPQYPEAAVNQPVTGWSDQPAAQSEADANAAASLPWHPSQWSRHPSGSPTARVTGIRASAEGGATEAELNSIEHLSLEPGGQPSRR